MMLLSQYICSTLLAVSFLSNGVYGEQIVIGYRTAQEQEALAINEKNELHRDEKYDEENAENNQLGSGFNMVNEPAGWTDSGIPWYCVIKADSEKIKAASKVWIPKSYSKSIEGETKSKNLWNFGSNNDDDILNYIESLDAVSGPKKALRFSYVAGRPGKLLMTIPTEVINDNDLEFWAQCWEYADDMDSNEIVDWANWDIVGKPDIMELESSDVDDNEKRLPSRNPWWEDREIRKMQRKQKKIQRINNKQQMQDKSKKKHRKLKLRKHKDNIFTDEREGELTEWSEGEST